VESPAYLKLIQSILSVAKVVKPFIKF